MRIGFCVVFYVVILVLVGCFNGFGLIGKVLLVSWVIGVFFDVGCVYDDVIVLDLYIDILFIFVIDEEDLVNCFDVQVDFFKLNKGGVDVVFYVVFVLQMECIVENYNIVYE